mgnify:CR=1 FL=1
MPSESTSIAFTVGARRLFSVERTLAPVALTIALLPPM